MLPLKVAVYWVGVANQSELNTSPCTLTLDLAGRRTKNTEGEMENDIPENCALPKSTHILTRNLAENAVNN